MDNFNIILYPDNTCGITRYIGNEKDVVIPDAIEGHKVVSILKNAFRYSDITSIKLPNSIHYIGDHCFDNCSRLVKINIPEGIHTIEEETFNKCSSLKEISIPDSATQLSPGAFANCVSLTHIKLPEHVKIGFDRVHRNYAPPVFFSCTSLTDVYIPKTAILLQSEPFSCCDSIPGHLITFNLNDDNIDTEDTVIRDDNNEIIDVIAQPRAKDVEEKIGCSWIGNKADCTEVVIPDGVTTIVESAFEYCTDLKTISLPSSLHYIGEDCFMGCTSLTQIDIPEGVRTIARNAFYGCFNLKEVTIPDSATQLCHGAFAHCRSLTHIKIPEYASFGVDSKDYEKTEDRWAVVFEDDWRLESKRIAVFEDCINLTDVVIPETVTFLDYNPFKGCNNIPGHLVTFSLDDAETEEIAVRDENNEINDTLNIPKTGKTEKKKGCTWIGNTEECTEVVIPKDVNAILGGAFEGCENLNSITLPSTLSYIGDAAFKNCKNLPNITLPSSISQIGEAAFEGCEKLTSINLPDSISEIKFATFVGCSALTAIKLPSSIQHIRAFCFKDCTALAQIEIPQGVHTIEQLTFFGCSNLKEVVIPDSATQLCHGAFAYCISLTHIKIPEYASFGVYNNFDKELGNEDLAVFEGCTSLKEVEIPATTKFIENEPFKDCNNIPGHLVIFQINEEGDNDGDKEEIVVRNEYGEIINVYDIPKAKDVSKKIGCSWIGNKDDCTEVVVPNGVTDIKEQSFASCKKLTSITLSPTLTSIGDSAFEGCEKLANITLPDSVSEIKHFAFRGCTSLTSINIPYRVKSIEYGVFLDCAKLAHVTLKQGLTKIGDSAFCNCRSLNHIKIPDSVTDIDSTAFMGCPVDIPSRGCIDMPF